MGDVEVCALSQYLQTIKFVSSILPYYFNGIGFSSLKSLTTIYRLNPIQPQRNQRIWLLCAVVIAFCAIRTSSNPLRNSKGLGCSPIFLLLKAMIKTLMMVSKIEVYLRRIEVLVRVYRSTGHCQPGRLWTREEMKWRAPWKREMWFGWEEMPVLSNVIRTSIVATGASLFFGVVGFASLGAKAEERSLAIFSLSQAVVMLSGKSLINVSIALFKEEGDSVRALDYKYIVLCPQT